MPWENIIDHTEQHLDRHGELAGIIISGEDFPAEMTISKSIDKINNSIYIKFMRDITELKTPLIAINGFSHLLITNDFEGEEVVEGKRIIYTPLWKWLLQ